MNFSLSMSAVGAEEFDSQSEADVSVTCLSEAFLDRDILLNLGASHIITSSRIGLRLYG